MHNLICAALSSSLSWQSLALSLRGRIAIRETVKQLRCAIIEDNLEGSIRPASGSHQGFADDGS